MRKIFSTVFALTLTALVAAQSHAASVVTITEEATTGLAGFTTYTLVASSDQGDIVGFNFDSTGGSGFGFSGPMNNVDPFGIITVFNDAAEGAYLGASAHISQDSHFNVMGATGLVVNPATSSDSLTAAFNLSGGASFANFPLAQLAIADGDEVTFNGQFTVAGAGGNILESVSGTVGVPVTGPTAEADVTPGSDISLQPAFDDKTGLLAGALNLSNATGDDSELTIEGIDVDVTSGPAGIFSANSSGLGIDFLLDLDLARTLPDDTVVTADVLVRTNGGNLNYTLSATVPEPATLSLMGLALVGIAGLRRRS